MTDEQKLFLSMYPAWPLQLLEKYANVLSLEVAKIKNDIAGDIVNTYYSMSDFYTVKVYPYSDNQISLYNPQNQRYVSKVYFGPISQTIIEVSNAPQGHFQRVEKYSGAIVYDNRIFTGMDASVNIEYKRIGDVFPYSYLNIGSYETMYVQAHEWTTFLKIGPSVKKYDGAESVLAMIENGVNLKVDYVTLKEFVVFLNAYKKYNMQLSAFNALQSQKKQQLLTEYNQQISDKLNQRKNDLNDLKIQITFAAKNEVASAKRDMQSLAIAAQNMIQDLQKVI